MNKAEEIKITALSGLKSGPEQEAKGMGHQHRNRIHEQDRCVCVELSPGRGKWGAVGKKLGGTGHSGAPSLRSEQPVKLQLQLASRWPWRNPSTQGTGEVSLRREQMK